MGSATAYVPLWVQLQLLPDRQDGLLIPKW